MYRKDFDRTGFQGGLNGCRRRFEARSAAERHMLAGHWVQQEQPQAVTAALLAFLGRVAAR